MKEENLYRRRFSLCPTATSPPKIDPRVLTRNLSYGGDNELYPLSPGNESEQNGLPLLRDKVSPARSPSSMSESRMFIGVEKESSSPTEKLARKESLKVQKMNYRQEKKRVAKELFSALKDPSVVIMSNWLKIRGTLKSWTKLWCVLRPGILVIYKTPGSDHWVGTILLNTCKLIERPSKKDGFCFKVYHPLDKSIWGMKGPKGETVGSITQPLPSNYLIFRAASESDGRCWMDALELALSCSSLSKVTAKSCRDVDLSSSSESSHILQLLQSAALMDPDLLQLNDSMLENNHMENDANSNKSEREAHEDSDNAANENGGRLTEESDMDQSDDVCLQATAFVEEAHEEMGEAGEVSQVETVSEENKGLIWTLLKQLRPGMDLSKVVLPTFILEPRSFLDKLSDYYYHADLLSQAVTEENPYCRMKQVLRWYLSGFYKKPKGLKKPYNPILGEMFRCCWLHPQTDSCTFYIAEQVSHHPPISAFYISNKKDGFCISGSILAKSKFYGNSLSAILDGKARLLFLSRDEEYVITMPYAHCKGILYGTMTLELGGKITIECEKTQYFTELEFKLKPFLGSSCNVNQISGKIQMGEDVLATVDGHWDRKVHLTEKKTGHQEVLWNPSADVRRQRLKRQVVQMDQQEAFESERLWRHVTRAINDKDQNNATQEKFVLEEAQRQEARERGDRPWNPRLFTLDTDTNEWHYKYADTKPWDTDRCLVQFEKDGVIQTKEKSQSQLNSFSYSQNWAVEQKVRVNGKHRKSSSQPSSCSQNTESSSTTPEPNHESSDNEGYMNQCTRCTKEVKDIVLIEASVAAIQKTQQDIQRNLSALGRQIARHKTAVESNSLGSRHCFILCMLLFFQLLINYVFT
ncbi:oxysterol-binding protein-related protein 5-like isoform X2 [Xyrauchen texanus]|uniref:oxysterol-binding protein-related protein 5-like isoform X2 n=1 Tax=Xyrauchen texanus TaxID=154827 RepID=UPI002241B059|nr:oxysterol-binding protein-related protein 5-like isoform X2 [Xyrauchen texanus]